MNLIELNYMKEVITLQTHGCTMLKGSEWVKPIKFDVNTQGTTRKRGHASTLILYSELSTSLAFSIIQCVYSHITKNLLGSPSNDIEPSHCGGRQESSQLLKEMWTIPCSQQNFNS